MTDSTAPAKSGGIRDLGKMFGAGTSGARQFGILGALVLIIIIFQVLTGGKTLDPGNVINIVRANAYVLILAIGMVMVIVAGHIDLSVGSVAAFVNIVVVIALKAIDQAWGAGDSALKPVVVTVIAIALALLIGAIVGAWQGFWVAYVGVPAFIVTLAGMLVFRGANQWIGNSTPQTVPNYFNFIGGGYIPDFPPYLPFSNGTVILGILAALAVIWNELRMRRRQREMGAASAPVWVSGLKLVLLVAVIAFATFLFGTGRAGTSFPIPGILLVVLVLIYSFVTNSTVTGRHIYSVGGNWHAAELSGVNIKRTNFFVMMNMSMLAGLAGVVYVSRSLGTGPGDGQGWELDAIAAVFIGGAAVSGGIGTVIGSIIGGLVIAVLNNGLQLLSVESDKVQVIKGLVLLVAVALDVVSKRSGGRSLIARFRRPGGDLDASPTLTGVINRPDVAPTGDPAEASARPSSTTPNA
ncbi:sugar ABC transporter permease [Galbitalea sp. SE-J8]|uniref:ABC transporter permease subunit n=1 Tax=Galbitalea sp. SE-J8 TaxID=3054952 RepID=UPI00259CD1B7|nr:sugar ABC transporter permease [Galbitalea sp. SE-J8]MDM4762492.1 sugar ABC transporter permease [Galbitalea sp. SE-J8]